jgi:subtilisin family serine protease
MKRKLIALGTALTFSVILFSCSESMTDLNPQSAQNLNQSNLSQPSNLSKTIVPDDAYIVVYKDQTSDKELDAEVEDMDKSEGVKAEHVYKSAIKGYAARLTPAALAKLKKNPNVAYIEKDQVMSINTIQSITPSWGIDRIDQVALPLSSSFTYNATASGVDAYIIDTGILTTHQEFGGRAVGGFSSIGTSTNWTDQNGHGTHVAGTVGGATYGVAKNVNLYAVRVLDGSGSGTTSGVIAGINWAITHHTSRPAVANMSLGGGASSSLDAAVQSAVNDGIVMCVAAGNNSRNASNYSPARVSAAITVGASGAYPTLGTNYDAYASYSNYGSIVDLFAPGSYITSAWYLSNTATNTISGTSMATPHVTGVAALYKSNNPAASPAAVEAALKSASTKGKITGLPTGTANNLLFTNN